MADSSVDPAIYGGYVCTLNEELQAKAEKELNEKPAQRAEDIQKLRNMVEKRKDLRIRTDDGFLLRFLRAKKFDLERALTLIVKHYQMKAENPELMSNLRPSAVKHVLEAGVTGVLHHRDREGRKVIIFRPGLWDPEKFGLGDIFRTNFITLSKLIEDEETQINGVVMIADLKGMGWNHAKNMSPFYAKRIAGLLQDCFPMRFKGVHYVHEPKIFDYIFALIKPFMKEKILSRINFHGDHIQELADIVDPEFLPEEYGGKKPPFSNKEWADCLLSCDTQFDAEAKHGLIINTPLQTKQKEDAVDGVVGSFRKLET
ncbi:hypothetical protein CHS0354_029519 [Potamilus streckersoni]|uniref:CRAL-TRIO domain-containing protein n=1 Tax=Potamilus streckersoni TaxID=2493646 RepID=A0AAE0T1X5_9BIVA|nr:hypothetical protein CHS0354_029519 [Potamilus streckersoni]